MKRHLVNGKGFWELEEMDTRAGDSRAQACQNLNWAQWDRRQGGSGPEARVGRWVEAMLTSGVPVGYSPVSQCLHSRYTGLRPRNRPVQSFCLGCSDHSTAIERRRSEVRTHAH